MVTDRVVLDRQLQNTVAQFEQTPGVVRKIDGTSRQLKAAIEGQAKIIITTIQKFSTDHLRVISGQGTRRFAVLIDEAHGSQSGKSAQALSVARSGQRRSAASRQMPRRRSCTFFSTMPFSQPAARLQNSGSNR